jgi:hypothetical protein
MFSQPWPLLSFLLAACLLLVPAALGDSQWVDFCDNAAYIRPGDTLCCANSSAAFTLGNFYAEVLFSSYFTFSFDCGGRGTAIPDHQHHWRLHLRDAIPRTLQDLRDQQQPSLYP